MEAMSTAWKSSLCSRATGACPVMHRIGMESPDAEYRPVIMSVPAGPEVPMHTPMLPARVREYPSAMCAAPSTWRARMWLIAPRSRRAEDTGLIAAPGTPNACVTPSRSMIATAASAAFMRAISPPAGSAMGSGRLIGCGSAGPAPGQLLGEQQQRRMVQAAVALRAQGGHQLRHHGAE